MVIHVLLRRWVLSALILGLAAAPHGLAADTAIPHGKLDRGLAVRRLDEGRVYLSWRLLAADPAGATFDVYRQIGESAPVKRNREPLAKTTDFIDDAADSTRQVKWSVRLAGSAEADTAVSAAAAKGDCQSIRLPGEATVQKVGIADLDGDGRFDFVVKQPNDNIDPYEKYWKPSPDTYQLEAYRGDGTFLWRYDLGWAIERGIWYSPYAVYDLDGDGRAEVAVKTGEGDPRDKDGRVRLGAEFVTILDGASGAIVTQASWIPRELFDEGGVSGYNYASRNQMAVAYLDGSRPSLLVQRGTYKRMILVAYDYRDGKLRERWTWDNGALSSEYAGQGAHWMHAVDVDADGRQEVVLGSVVIDDNGRELWNTGLGHPDHSYVGDIDPQRPGLEIYFGIERRQKEANGMCLVCARTGKILWGHQGPTRHVHSYGMCSDIDARYPGSECYSTDTDEQKKAAWARLRSSQGEVLSEELLWGFGPRTVYWDADPQRELLLKQIEDYPSGGPLGQIEGSIVAVADVLGDWREEILTSLPGELRIYSTAIPAADRRICLMQDPLYRMDVVVAAMGYYQIPMLSYDMASQPAP